MPLEGAAHAIQYAGVFGGRAGNAGIPDVRVADDALSVALFTETADGDARLLAAHDQIWVVLRHFVFPGLIAFFAPSAGEWIFFLVFPPFFFSTSAKQASSKPSCHEDLIHKLTSYT